MSNRMLRLAFLLPILHALPALAQTEYFESKVRPLLDRNCAVCHGPKSRMGGLDFTTSASITAAKPRLLDVVGYLGKVKMPPAGRLKDTDIGILREWLASGGPVPQQSAAPAKSPRPTLWSTIPPEPVPVPVVKDTQWPRTEIDKFVLSRMDAKGLRPVQAADKRTLLRRATFDLTGLPPTEAEMSAFLSDPAPGAFEKVIDRLLDSPRYAERWARHWLDVARYADSTGTDEDHRYPHAWRYRDYVIDSFRRDLPYNQFVMEQIAGDLLPAPPGEALNTRGIVATGFLALGPKLLVDEDRVKIIYDIVDEQIEVMSRGILGLTIACARCHDHKTDPISTRDYYSLASIFASTKQVGDMSERVIKLFTVPLVPQRDAAAWTAHQKQVTAKEQEITLVRNKVSSARLVRLRPHLAGYLIAAHQVYAGGASLDATAQSASLDKIALQRMVDYLKPDGERKPHLEAWHKADAAAIPTLAHDYQRRFEATQQARAVELDVWRNAVATAKQAGRTPPEMPRYFTGDDRFLSEVNSGSTGPFALPANEAEAAPLIPDEAKAQLLRLKAELAALKQSGPRQPPMACAVAEGDRVDQRVFIRGSHEAKGDPVAKAFPAVLTTQQPQITSGSGRLELARWLGSSGNPLTARVIVNRVWHWHFGQGIVRTPSNFGFTGEAPTHPELLDWLALQFAADGWSIKKLHRRIMLSSVYQLSSQPMESQRDRDPENRLITHFNRRRLEAEELRDALLSLDGSLDLTMGGTLQSGEGTDDFSTKRLSFSPEESKRRTVYLPLRRSNVPTSLMLFDFGDATTTMELRNQTNIAPQALYLMNSPFVAARAETIAKQLLTSAASDADRIRSAWLRIVNAPAAATDVDDALTFLRSYPRGNAEQSWKSYVRALIASNDFLYIR
ncbi:MAG: DUF1553 domain-containing protein [Acidobacteria bacterium]|nr:DUF1553 domain-containing protein [Acidobacteriota bacterium]